MSEIEKMYENAGINKREIENCTYKNSTPCGHSCDDGEDCPYLEIKNDYPPFTAEKQLNLIKWVAIHQELYTLSYEREFLWCSQTDWQSSFCYENFEESIANLIITLWQSLTEEEKEQIKRILGN